MQKPVKRFGFSSIRPLVRYVDEQRAVIDVHFTLVDEEPGDALVLPGARMDVEVQMASAEGDVFRHHARFDLLERAGMMRFEITQPERWWPAGMGEQALYDLTVHLIVGDNLLESRTTQIGLTSVRPADRAVVEMFRENVAPPQLLINGQPCAIQSVVPVEPVDEQAILPVTGESLLVVCDHFGPDVLFHAADRAGLLVLQSVPVDQTARGFDAVAAQVERLASHPSLVGWLLEKEDAAADLVRRIRVLDPTRSVFRRSP